MPLMYVHGPESLSEAESFTEDCSFSFHGFSSKTYCDICDGYLAAYYESISSYIPTGWDGVGVRIKDFYPDNPLDGMPNIQDVVEKFDLGYGANLVSLSVNGVGLRNNMGPGTMTLEGFSYSSNDNDRYAVCLAFLKDILDAESANALIKWIEELDRLQGELKQAIINGDSAKEASLEAALNAHRAPLKENYVSFGNIEVKWQTSGNVISLYMRNK